MRKRRPLAGVLLAILIGLGMALIVPWAFHIGGRFTPLWTWTGTGELLTKGGKQRRFFVSLHPASSMSRLRLDGLRPSSGLGGSACLCTAPGKFQYLRLSGTIYGAWLSTENSLLQFRLIEQTLIDVGQARAGYFDLYGRWRGQQLVMDDRGEASHPFRSGLRVEHASVTLDWSSLWSCSNLCAE